MRLRTIIFGALVLIGSFAGATLRDERAASATDRLPQQVRPALVAMPPLPPLTGNTVVLAPAAIALSAISEALDAQAPRDLSGKAAKSGVEAVVQRGSSPSPSIAGRLP